MNELIASWKREEEVPFTGWDFSRLEGRMIQDEPPWSYIERAQQLMDQVDSVLDMDTGGGERLLEMKEHWPESVVATEGYAPNLKLARERLEPLGVEVVDLWIEEDLPMPFTDAKFGLVLNRHSAFNADEVARISSPGGTFLTQQIHGLWAQDLQAAFDSQPKWPDATPEHYAPWLESAGMKIVECREWSGDLRFVDVGALVYYLHAVPWTVEGFSVETHLPHLLKLQERLEREGRLVFAARMYVIEARKGTE